MVYSFCPSSAFAYIRMLSLVPLVKSFQRTRPEESKFLRMCCRNMCLYYVVQNTVSQCKSQYTWGATLMEIGGFLTPRPGSINGTPFHFSHPRCIRVPFISRCKNHSYQNSIIQLYFIQGCAKESIGVSQFLEF